MKVLGHRVLVKPDPQPTAAESGIILPEDRDFVATSGEVVDIGAGGSAWRYHARQATLQHALDAIDAEHTRLKGTAFEAGLRQAIGLVTSMLGTAAPEMELRVGQRIAFDADSGLQISVDGEPHLILNHDDVVVIVAEVAA